MRYAESYGYEAQEDESGIIEIAKRARKQGYLKKSEFVAICEWKSKRPRKYYSANEPALIREISKIVFSKDCGDEARIRLLMTLKGVKIRMASAILHLTFLGDKDGYPIIDFRVMRALTGRRFSDNDFTMPVWLEYTYFFRKMAKKFGIDMRTLDRALWSYDEEKN